MQVGISVPVCQLPLPHSGCRVTSSPNTPALPHLRGGVQELGPREAGDGIKDLKLRLLLGCREDPGLQQKPLIHLCEFVWVCMWARAGGSSRAVPGNSSPPFAESLNPEGFLIDPLVWPEAQGPCDQIKKTQVHVEGKGLCWLAVWELEEKTLFSFLRVMCGTHTSSLTD